MASMMRAVAVAMLLGCVLPLVLGRPVVLLDIGTKGLIYDKATGCIPGIEAILPDGFLPNDYRRECADVDVSDILVKEATEEAAIIIQYFKDYISAAGEANVMFSSVTSETNTDRLVSMVSALGLQAKVSFRQVRKYNEAEFNPLLLGWMEGQYEAIPKRGIFFGGDRSLRFYLAYQNARSIWAEGRIEHRDPSGRVGICSIGTALTCELVEVSGPHGHPKLLDTLILPGVRMQRDAARCVSGSDEQAAREIEAPRGADPPNPDPRYCKPGHEYTCNDFPFNCKKVGITGITTGAIYQVARAHRLDRVLVSGGSANDIFNFKRKMLVPFPGKSSNSEILCRDDEENNAFIECLDVSKDSDAIIGRMRALKPQMLLNTIHVFTKLVRLVSWSTDADALRVACSSAWPRDNQSSLGDGTEPIVSPPFSLRVALMRGAAQGLMGAIEYFARRRGVDLSNVRFEDESLAACFDMAMENVRDTRNEELDIRSGHTVELDALLSVASSIFAGPNADD